MTENAAGRARGPGLLKLFRDTHGASLQKVAEAIGCSRSLVWEFEHGKTKPDLEHRRKIAKFTEEKDPDTGETHPAVPVLSWDPPGLTGAEGVVPYLETKAS